MAEEALRPLSGEASHTLGKPESVSRVLLDLLIGVGMDPADAEATLRGLGHNVVRQQDEPAAGKGSLTVVSLKGERARAALERALLVGVQLARIDVDYAHVSDDAVAFDALRKRAVAVERELFDDRIRARLDFFSRAVLVLQDQVQSEAEPERRNVIATVLARFDDELISLQEETNRAMAALPSDPDSLFWGDSEDRRRYYFKMGVTNSLRRSGHMSSLGHLYRFRGVNYDVEEAFQLAGEEEPLLLRAANLEFSALVSLRPPDVRRMTNERRLSRFYTQTES